MSYPNHMKAAPDSRTYTVKDVASLISPLHPNAAVEQLIRQVRHWTVCNLLTTIGAKKPGTGRSRVYDAHQVRKAAVLVELTRYGIQVGELDTFGEWADMLAGHDHWQAAVEGKHDVYLQMAFNADGGGSWSINGGAPDLFALKTNSPLKRPVKVRLLDGGTLDVPIQDFSTALVFNITKIFKRLRV